MRLTCILVALLLFSAAPSLAAIPSLEQGQQLFNQRRYSPALSSLLIAFEAEPANPEVNFLLGRTYFELGNFEAAVMAFERVLFVEPNSSRVKLEMARAFMALNSNEFARQYFQEVLATNPPEAVWSNIQNFLAGIKESEKHHFFTGTLSYGLDVDDNPRTAPVDDLISLGSFEFQLQGNGATPASDYAHSLTATANHIYRRQGNGFFWKTSALTYNSFYDNQSDLNVNYLEISSGPAWKKGLHLWQNNLLYTLIRLNQAQYRDGWGLQSTLTSQIMAKLFITSLLRFEDRTNQRYDYRSGQNYKATINPVFILPYVGRLSLGVTYEYDDTKQKTFSYNRLWYQARIDHQFPFRLAFYANYDRKDSEYKETDAMFQVKKDDTVEEFGLGLSRPLWQSETQSQNLILALSYRHTDATSNIDLYTYRKNVGSISLTYGF